MGTLHYWQEICSLLALIVDGNDLAPNQQASLRSGVGDSREAGTAKASAACRRIALCPAVMPSSTSLFAFFSQIALVGLKTIHNFYRTVELEMHSAVL